MRGRPRWPNRSSTSSSTCATRRAAGSGWSNHPARSFASSLERVTANCRAGEPATWIAGRGETGSWSSSRRSACSRWRPPAVRASMRVPAASCRSSATSWRERSDRPSWPRGLKRERTELSAIIANASDAILVFDAERRVTRVNPGSGAPVRARRGPDRRPTGVRSCTV